MSTPRNHSSGLVSDSHIQPQSISATYADPSSNYEETPEMPVLQDAPYVTSPSLVYASDTQNHLPNNCSQSLSSFAGFPPEDILKDDSFAPYDDTNFDWFMQAAPETQNLGFFEMPFDSANSNLFPHKVTQNAQNPAAMYHESEPAKENWLLNGTASAGCPSAIPQLSVIRVNPSQTGFYCQLERLTESDRARVQQSIRLALERPLWTPISLENFPSKETLDHCVDLFFANWNPIVSFIHRPTFNPTTAPEVLLISMACIGARFTKFSGAPGFSSALAELGRRLLIATVERSPEVARTETYFTSQLLLGVYGYCSADKTLFTYIDSLRGILVRNGKLIGLFRDPPTRVSDSSGNKTESQWMTWVAAERWRRIGWAVYEFDASVSFLHNQRPLFSTGDMMLSLPSDASCWDAPSAHSWMALRSQGSADNVLTHFRLAVRSTFDTSLSEDFQFNDGQHLHLIVLTLARFLWSIKELQASPLQDVVPEQWPFLAHKSNLLDKLDSYLTPLSIARMSGNDQELRQAVARALMIHISHLYGANDLMDWLPGLLRSAGKSEMIKERMKTWGKEDPVRLRRVIYHSAQIIAISRDFPFNAPYEPFFVFHAGAALWCAAQLLGEAPTDSESDNSVNLLFLDRHITDGDVDYFKVLKWIREGGSVVIGLHGVPILGAQSSHVQVMEETVRILRNMRVWALSGAFIDVLRRFI
ncbi:hypothetical protein PV08_00012 [Exophiala spinifera]|uniref:Xylanolytic transcriptional activator regulatory domain-containing protein n=1 Tax=Exophiala spinifera TaxID=91928 RepID=A0A0D2BLJ6_9EURO|nr:uncharacterized protein PV08_00012 [Exophiala spinifera]KIW19440.1 hypothetical protein PV08_00012 [Exophiala spinifera]